MKIDMSNDTILKILRIQQTKNKKIYSVFKLKKKQVCFSFIYYDYLFLIYIYIYIYISSSIGEKSCKE